MEAISEKRRMKRGRATQHWGTSPGLGLRRLSWSPSSATNDGVYTGLNSVPPS